jgi:hypothetical protein
VKLHERFPTVTFGQATYSCTTLPPTTIWPTKVHELSRVQFASLAEVKPIVEYLRTFEAKTDFYADEASRSIDDPVGKEVGVDRGFSIVVYCLKQFFKRNALLDECFPFVYGGNVVGQMDFAFSAATGVAATSAAASSAGPTGTLVAGEFKPVTYNTDARKSKGRSEPAMSMKKKFREELKAWNSGKFVSPILQTCDYSWVNGVFFSILATYAHMWLFIRDCHGNLVIFQSFPRGWCPTDGSMSVVQAIVVFLWLARSKAIPKSLIEAKLLAPCSEGCAHTRAVARRNTAAAADVPGNGGGSGGSSGTGGGSKNGGGGSGGGSGTGGGSKNGGNGNTASQRRYGTRSQTTKNDTANDAVINMSDDDDAVQDPEDVSLYLYDVETDVFGKAKQEFLPSGRTGTTIRYRSDSGLDIVSKKADLYKQAYLKSELQHEAAAYAKMHDLQGDVIPEFKGYGLDPRALFLYTLTTSHAGVPLCDVETVFEDEKAQAVAALKAVHAAGVLHGDIKPENIMVQRSGEEGKPGKVRLLDFGCANLDDSDPESFARAAAGEQWQLARVLEQ